jgi:hypothetical protein
LLVFQHISERNISGSRLTIKAGRKILKKGNFHWNKFRENISFQNKGEKRFSTVFIQYGVADGRKAAMKI